MNGPADTTRPEDETPEQSTDDTSVGWGDDVREATTDPDEWYLSERPPHHGT